MIVLPRRKRLVAIIASLWHNIALYQGNNLPLPGTKQYVGRFIKKHHSSFYSSLFTKSAETPINTGVARGEEWRITLHLSSPLFTPLSSDYARKLNEKSTCSVFEESHADFADDADFPGEEWVKRGEEWRQLFTRASF